MNELIDLSSLKDELTEKRILGAILQEPDCAGSIEIEPEYFYNPKNQIIFKAIQDVILRGEKPDLTSVSYSLKSKEVDLYYLTGITNDFYSSAHIKQDAKRLIELWQSRELYKLFIKSSELLPEEPMHRVLDEFYYKLQKIDNGINNKRAKPLKEFIQSFKDQKTSKPVTTGLIDLDDLLDGGLRPGQLFIIGARPGVGKTAMAGTISLNIARAGLPVVFFSLEMTGAELAGRFISATGKVNADRIKNPNKRDREDERRINSALTELESLPIVIDDSQGNTLAKLISRAKLLCQRHKPAIVIIDYLQLIRAGKSESRNYEIAEITRALKRFAIDNEISVILLSQLNRQADKGEPTLKDLRDSGAIESDADLVLFIYLPVTDEDGLILAKLAKNRSGRTGKFKLSFIKDQTRFVNYSNMEVTSHEF